MERAGEALGEREREEMERGGGDCNIICESLSQCCR